MFSTQTNKKAKSPTEAKPQRADAATGKESPEPNPVWQSLALNPLSLQPKLTISQAGDPHEQEADRIAEEVLRMPATSPGSHVPTIARVSISQQQRQCAECEEAEEQVKRKEGSSADGIASVPSIVHDTVNSTGQPLDPKAQAYFEPRLGRDLSQVRVHVDAQAAGAARGLGARAFTLGRDLVFATGEYDPQSERGRSLLAHELAHVAQQAGPSLHHGAEVIRRRPTSAAPAASPLQEAVRLLSSGTSTGASLLTAKLVNGVRSSEAMFLRERPLDRWAEALGLAGTVGPGQLGQSAITQVNTAFTTEKTAFEATFGPAPATWKEAATDVNWSYFYIAAYLVYSINRAETIFQPATPTLTNSQIGVLELGIALYHGAFEMIRDVRRRIANNRHISVTDVTIQMVDEELRSDRSSPAERELLQYTQLARGYFDFTFAITAARQSRRFWIHDGKVRINCQAAYQSTTPSSSTPRSNTYLIRLHRFEVVSGGGGAVAEGTAWYTQFSYNVGARESKEWTGLPRGEYMFKVEKNESTYSPDVLEGVGSVETAY